MRKPIHEFDKFNDLKDMLKNTEKKFSNRPAYIFKTDKEGVFKEI